VGVLISSYNRAFSFSKFEQASGRRAQRLVAAQQRTMIPRVSPVAGFADLVVQEWHNQEENASSG